MKRIFTPFATLVALLWIMSSRAWFNVFHVTAILIALAVVGIIRHLFLRHRDDGETAEHESSPWARVFAFAAIKGAFVIGWVLLAVWAAEKTPAYPLWANRDLSQLSRTLDQHEQAGNYGHASDLIRARLRVRITPPARHDLVRRFHDNLVKSAKQAIDRGDPSRAQPYLAEARGVAAVEKLPTDLADELLKLCQGEEGFRAQLRRWKDQGDWNQVAIATRERMRLGNDPSETRRLAPSLVEALSEIAGSGIDLEIRAQTLTEAAQVARQSGLEDRAIARQLTEVQNEISRRAAIDQAIADSIKQGHWAAAHKTLREEIVRSETDRMRRSVLAARLFDLQLDWAQSLADDPQRKPRLEEAVRIAHEFKLDDKVARARLKELEDLAMIDQQSAQLATLRREREQTDEQRRSEQAEAQSWRKQSGELARQLEAMTQDRAGLRAEAQAQTSRANQLNQRVEQLSTDLANAEARHKLHAPRQLEPGVEAGLIRLSTDRYPLLLADIFIQKNSKFHPGLESRDFIIVGGLTSGPCVASPVSGSSQRLPIRIVLLIDCSGSMNQGGRMKAAQAAAKTFYNAIPADVPVQLMSFASDVSTIGSFSVNRPDAFRMIDRLQADGDTAFYQAIKDAALKLANSRSNPAEIPMIVALTDGEDTVGGVTLTQAVEICRKHGVRVQTIGLNVDGIQTAPLSQLARQTAGQFFEAARPEDLTVAFQAVATRVTQPFYVVAFIAPVSPAMPIHLTIGSGPHAAKVPLTLPTFVDRKP